MTPCYLLRAQNKLFVLFRDLQRQSEHRVSILYILVYTRRARPSLNLLTVTGSRRVIVNCGDLFSRSPGQNEKKLSTLGTLLLDGSICATLFVRVQCIVEEVWLVMATTTLGLGRAGTLLAALTILVVKAGGGVEAVIIRSPRFKCIRRRQLGRVHRITLENGAFACAWCRTARFHLAIFNLPVVLDRLGNALVAKLHFGAVNALLVQFTERVQLIDWLALAAR
jgi:hypothetical protein